MERSAQRGNGDIEMNYYPIAFFIISAVYIAPHLAAWTGNLFGIVFMCLGWYALWMEEKRND